MNIDRVVKRIGEIIAEVVKVWKYYQGKRREAARLRKEAERYEEFIEYGIRMAEKYEREGIVFPYSPECINGVWYLSGVYPDGAKFYREIRFKG